jgi:hypothetical protein
MWLRESSAAAVLEIERGAPVDWAALEAKSALAVGEIQA